MSLADAYQAKVDEDDPTTKGTIEVGPDGADVTGVITDKPILDNDWSAVFERFNLDPAKFEVVDDTVRMSTYQQSARTADGDRDVVQLYSYKARFRRVDKQMVPPETLEAWRQAIMEAPMPPAQTGLTGGVYLILVADPQLGKPGTDKALANWKRGVHGHITEIRRLIDSGVSVGGVHVAFMGDETENVANSYGNQSHIIELNLSEQIKMDYEMRLWTFRQVAELRLPMTGSSVMSNHGEFTRNGSKDPVTSQADNTSTMVAHLVKSQLDALHEAGAGPLVEWTIGDVDPAVVVNLGGVDCYFTHGHVQKGRGASSEIRTRSAIERQILGSTEALGDVRLWFVAHYHHHYSNEFEGRTLWGCPALEAERSSEYMLNQYGVWSPPGMLGMLIGGGTAREWSYASVR